MCLRKPYSKYLKLQGHERIEKIMKELKICSKLPGFWTVHPCVSQKEQVLGTGSVGNLG